MTPTLLKNKIKTGLLIFILAINAAFLKIAILGQFDQFDYGAFMDLAWRIICGQKLYTDVITHVQPLFPHIMALFMKIFGYGRHGALAHIIASSSAMIVLVYAIVRRLPAYAVAIVLSLTMVGFYWNYPFPAYNQDGFLFGMPGVLALSMRLPFSTKRSAFMTSFICGLFAVLSAMIKINIGAVYGIVFAGTLMLGPFKKESFAGLTAGGLLGIAFVFPMIGDVREFLSQNYLYAHNQTVRMHHVRFFAQSYWIPVALVLLHLGKDALQRLQRTALFLGIFFVALIHYNTSSMFIQAHIPLMGTLVGFGWLLIEEVRTGTTPGAFLKIIRLFTVPALIIFSVFQMAQSAAFGLQIAFGKHPNHDLLDDYTFKEEPFAGMQGSRGWGEPLDQIPAYVKQNVPQKDSMLIIGPFLPVYAITGHQSYRGVNYDFKIDNTPAPQHVQRVKNVILNNPPDWIITYKDRSLFPINALVVYMEIQPFILTHYRPEKTWDGVALLKKVR